MATEIERKFLVTGDGWRERVAASRRIVQGYLASDEHRSLRVRVAGDEAWLTVKGGLQGISRAEFEYPIPLADAENMLALCLPGVIEKIRHHIPHGGRLWEVDEFLGENRGLIVAEIELEDAKETPDLPEWAGKEVTTELRYQNALLAREPFLTWADEAR